MLFSRSLKSILFNASNRSFANSTVAAAAAATRRHFSSPYLCSPFSTLAHKDLPKVLDVLRLEQDSHGYFINFPGRTMPIPNSKSIYDAQLSLLQEYGFGEMHFRNKEGVQYSASTPIEVMLTDDFYIELENQHFFIVNTSKTALMQLGGASLFPSTTNSLLEASVRRIATVGGNSLQQQTVVSTFLSEFLDRLAKDPKEQIDKQHLNLIVNNVLNELSVRNNRQIAALDALIAVQEKKLAHDLSNQKDVETTVVAKKMRKFFKRFFAMVLAQVAMIQYGTYVFISWDFMEPITCLLGIADATLAFGYWFFVNQKYDYETLASRKNEKVRRSSAYTSQIDESDIFARKDVLEYLYRQKLYLSNQLPTFLQTFAQQKDLFKFVNSVGVTDPKI